MSNYYTDQIARLSNDDGVDYKLKITDSDGNSTKWLHLPLEILVKIADAYAEQKEAE